MVANLAKAQMTSSNRTNVYENLEFVMYVIVEIPKQMNTKASAIKEIVWKAILNKN